MDMVDTEGYRSRFRVSKRYLCEEEREFIAALRAKATELEMMIERIGSGRYKSLAMASLEVAVMWAVRELTADGADGPA